MTELPSHMGDAADDARLLARARTGDSDAFAELYSREVEPARRLARILVGGDKAEELVAESFARVLAQLNAGRGPTDDFRAYLHVTIRNGYRDGLRATRESPSSDQPWLLDDVLPPVEELVEDLDRDVAVTALATLPKSWQQVLWHVEVEGRKPAEVAGILDIDAGAVSSLAYRAREGLKRAYLDQHFQAATTGQCGWAQSRMSQYVRGDLSARAQQKAADHIDGCSDCTAAFATVDRVNQKLAAWLFPVVLWGMVGAHKGGLWWIAGAAGAGATGTPIGGPSVPSARSGPNPVVAGAAAAVAAAALAGGVATALVAASDQGAPRDRTAAATSRAGDTLDPPGSTEAPSPSRNAPTDDSRSSADRVPVPAPPTDPPTAPVATPAPTPPATALPTGSTTGPAAPGTTPTTPTTTPTPTLTTTPTVSPTPTPTVTPTPTPTTTPPPEPVTAGLADVVVEVAPDGHQARGPFELTVTSTVAGSRTAEVAVLLALDETWVVSAGSAGDGWSCGLLADVLLVVTDSVSCTHAYPGSGAIPPLALRFEAPPLTQQAIKPHGTATLTVDGTAGVPGSMTF